MRGYGYGLWLMALSCWMHGAVAAPAAGAAPAASAASAAPTRSPEEDYRLGMKARWSDDNFPDAILNFTHAAERGHAAAQAELADILEAGSAWKSALGWWRKSAEQGYAPGQYGLGMILRVTKGDVKQDFVEARKWITLAANQGHAAAIDLLANAYLGRMPLGLDANALNSPEVLLWIKRAADINSGFAIKALADAYRSGKYGLAVDPAQADALEAKLKPKKEEKKEKKKRN